MPRPLLLLALLLALPLASGADDDFVQELGRFDALEAASDPALVALTAPRVDAVDKGQPAEAMGLRVGDLLVGLDGVRVIGKGEWDLVRFRRADQPEAMRIAVLRHGRVLELTSAQVLPVRRLGFSFSDDVQARRLALADLGFAVVEDDVVADLPPRAALALLRWHAHQDPAVDRTWIPALATLTHALRASRWAAAAALPPVAVPESCPQLLRLARFQGGLAAYHAQGERAPDPICHGVSLLWYVIHYPYPHLRLPALGAFAHPDQGFIAALEELRRHPERAARAPLLAGLQYQEGESHYAFVVRKAVLDPANHGGWPFRHAELYDGKRGGVLTGLRRQVAEGGPAAIWSTFALIQAELVDELERERDQALAKTLPKVAKLRADSPLLGYLALDVVASCCSYKHVAGTREALRAALLAGPLPDSEPPSRLLAHLREREVGQELMLLAEESAGLDAQLALVHGALSRAQPFADLRRQLADPGVADLPLERRRELLALQLDYVRDSCTPDDLVAMVRLDLPGAQVDALAEIALWHSRSRHDQDWLFADSTMGLHPALEQPMLGRMQAAIDALPWDQPAALPAAVEQARLMAGTPHATLRLAEACAAHGQAALAQALRERVGGLFARCTRLLELRELNRSAKRWLLEVQMLVYGPLAGTAALALEAGERYRAIEKAGEEWDSIALYQAHAALAAGQAELAIDWLCQSFGTPKRDEKPVFFDGAETVGDCRGFRTRLLRRLAQAGGGLTPTQVQRLGKAAIADQVDDGFAALLGVPRAKLTGAGAAPGADDF